jgi:hypothetical protein
VSKTLTALATGPAAPVRSASSGPFAATVFASHDASPPPLARTTLSEGSGQASTLASGGNRRGALIGVAVGGAALAGVIIFMATRGGDAATATTPPAPEDEVATPAAAEPLPEAVPDAEPDAAPTLAMTLESANPFVPSHGLHVQRRQVSQDEYATWLATLPDADRAAATPRKAWADPGATESPAAWVTHEDAVAFCARIGATLPTSDEWTTMSAGQWGLDPAGDGTRGPLQEWTSTVEEGLAIVRGGHARMKAAALAEAATEPLYKSTESQAGPDATAETVAGANIGFRCVRR